MTTDKRCFVISPIGEEASAERKRADQVLKHVIGPAVKACGYEATRADDISEPGIITSQVIQRVVDDPLVVADLTGSNPNVFYELAVRHATRKPLVQIIEKGAQIPFDVAGTRVIHVNHKDLDSAQEARDSIIAQIQSLDAGEGEDEREVETPISVSLDLQMLRTSEDPEERSLAEVISGISEVRAALVALEKRFDNSRSGFDRSDELYVLEKRSRMLNEIYRTLPEVKHLVLSLERSLGKAQMGLATDRLSKRDVEMLQGVVKEMRSQTGRTAEIVEDLMSHAGNLFTREL